MGLAGRGQDPTDPVRDDLDAEREAAESCIYLQELPQAAGSLPAASLLRRLSRLDLPDQCLLEFFFFSFFFYLLFSPLPGSARALCWVPLPPQSLGARPAGGVGRPSLPPAAPPPPEPVGEKKINNFGIMGGEKRRKKKEGEKRRRKASRAPCQPSSPRGFGCKQEEIPPGSLWLEKPVEALG